uniref:Uncharacterized protein n=1 Tax=Avena sativa TaxID=4498 RepID=A0ACD5VIT1_AVESA
MELKNTTAALVQSFGSVEGRLVRVEILVLFSFLSWVLLELFGSFRRQYSHGFFRLLVWTVYTLSTVLAPYTIGLLQAGPFRDQTFVLWGTILLLIQVNSESLSVYNIQDIEQRKRMLVQQVLQIFLVLWLIVNGSGSNKSYSATIWMFWAFCIILSIRKFRTLNRASKKGGLVEHSKVIADYMMVEHQLGQDMVDPRTMEGYSYIFHGEEELASLFPTAPEYRIGLKEVTDTRFITIDSVWRWIDSHSFKHRGTAKNLKQITLSFTLFKLLKRRFCGYRLGEASLDKTLHLVLHGLLSEKGRYVSAFRIIEVELAFLYDFFYTRMESGTTHCVLSVPVISAVIVWNSISGAFSSRHYHRSNLEQGVNGTDVIRWITIVLLAILVFKYTVMAFIVPDRLSSVDKIRRWIQDEREKPRTKPVIWQVFKETTWERKLGQYSLLRNFHYHPRNVLYFVSLGLMDAKREGQKPGKKIQLAGKVIICVLSQLKENNGKLENGQSALARNQLGNQFSWACTLPTHIHTILVWHIATTISGYEVLPEVLFNANRQVAQSLSDYCAYLVAFIPDMLPGHGYDTRRIFDAVIMEARRCLTGCETVSSRCEKMMMGLHGVGVDGTILDMGAKLGRELRDVVPDKAQRWKVLADFWGEFILFLAPSDNADIHAEMLATGGEFMTHLWALLTHAGILERPSSSSSGMV